MLVLAFLAFRVKVDRKRRLWPVQVAFSGTFPVWFNDDELEPSEVTT